MITINNIDRTIELCITSTDHTLVIDDIHGHGQSLIYHVDAIGRFRYVVFGSGTTTDHLVVEENEEFWSFYEQITSIFKIEANENNEHLLRNMGIQIKVWLTEISK